MDNNIIYYLVINGFYKECTCNNKSFYIKKTWINTYNYKLLYRLCCTKCKYCFNIQNSDWLYKSETRITWITI